MAFKDCRTAQEEVNSNSVPGRYVPICDEKGDYKVVQSDSSTGEYWCADPMSGKLVPGSRKRFSPPDCSLYMKGNGK